MNKKICFISLMVFLLAHSTQAQAQPAGKIPRIAFQLDSSPSTIASRLEGFRQGLRELGYVEGKNILIEWRSGESDPERRREIAAELARLKLDLIVSAGPTITRALKEATTVPIVMAQDTDPVGSGFAASLAKPGGTITGLAALAPEMSGKQLALMKEIFPKLSRMAILGNSSNPGDAQALRETVLAAGTFEMYLRYIDILNARDIDGAFQAAAKGRADALMVLGNPILNLNRKRIVDLAAKHRLPATYARPEYVEAGGLMYYGTNYNDLFRRAAYYVDKILKGAKPGDLPIEQPTKFEFLINLTAAKQIGVTIPQSVLYKADRVIR
jgi:putative tryptophan/tyrosine transport system substrate-binding protein